MKYMIIPTLIITMIGLFLSGFSIGKELEGDSINSLQPAMGNNVVNTALLEPIQTRLRFSTYLGGSNDEDYYGDMTIDAQGNIYVVGSTASPDFPTTPGAYDTSYNGGGDLSLDAFVAKFDPSGTSLLFSTFLGGAQGDDWANAVAVDSSGYIYVTGRTESADFPTRIAYDAEFNGASDVFLVKLNPTGTNLIYSTFYGSSSWEESVGIALDREDGIYITGYTYSNDFPTTDGAFIKNCYSTYYMPFVVKFLQLQKDNIQRDYSTCLGGGYFTTSKGIAVDSSGNAIVVGRTNGSLEIKPGAYDPSYNGNDDVFILKLNPDGSDLLFSTYLGGEGREEPYGMSVDTNSNLYITGETSSDFPTTPGAFDETRNSTGGYHDVFITKIDSTLSTLNYSTYLGGNQASISGWDCHDRGFDIDVSADGTAYIYGATGCIDFPLTQDAFQNVYNDGDAFVATLDPTGSDLIYSTYLGGSGTEFSSGAIKVTTNNIPIVMGHTESSDFPVSTNAFDPTYNGQWDIFLTTLAMVKPFLELPVNYSSFEEAAMGNTGDPHSEARVNSWFDHTNPIWGNADGSLQRWDGTFGIPPVGINNCQHPGGNFNNCYDSHNGLDIRSFNGNYDVLAAAQGLAIFETHDYPIHDCEGLGNCVKIDHQNCFMTLYGHLDSVAPAIQGASPQNPIRVNSKQAIGVMGNTGLNSNGVHLHFGVYLDPNCDGNWSDKKTVDPYGWKGTGVDPYSLTLNSPLWIHSINPQNPANNNGGGVSSVSGIYQVYIPPGAVDETVTLDLLVSSPMADPSAQMRSVGRSFRLRVLEWLSGKTTDNLASDGIDQFSIPITVTVRYTDALLTHLDETNLSIMQWDEVDDSWQVLTTTIDTQNNLSVAQTTETGYFDLQAPLLCSNNFLEPNDDYYASTYISSSQTIQESFDVLDDEDWFRVDTIIGMTYILESLNLAQGVDTKIELYDQDGITLLASDDNSGAGVSSKLEWIGPASGTYFYRVTKSPGSVFGCSATYDLKLTTIKKLYLPVTIR